MTDLLKVKYLLGRAIGIKNGLKTRFWSIPWLYDEPISKITPILFTLSEQKEICVADEKSEGTSMTFRRWLPPELQSCWDMILSDVHSFDLQDSNDVILWKLEKSRKFSVKSLYNALTRSDARLSHRKI